MQLMHKRVNIALDQRETVSGILCGQARNNRAGMIIAHGAGSDMENPFIVHLCNGLAEARHITFRFNFPYKEKGKKAPDGQKKLMHTWEKASWRLTGWSFLGTPCMLLEEKKSCGTPACIGFEFPCFFLPGPGIPSVIWNS